MESLTQYKSKYISINFESKNLDNYILELKKYIDIEKTNKNNLIRIRPKNYIGFIKIVDFSFYIKPKIEELDFWEILKEINDPLLIFFDYIIQYRGIKTKIDYFSAFISHFLDLIDLLLKRYYRKEYQKITEKGRRIKGRVNFKKHINKHPYFFEGIYCNINYFTFNNIYNQIIKYALNLCSKIINSLNFNVIKKFYRIYSYFELVKLIKIDNRVFSTIIYNSNTISYQRIHQICKLIINYLKISQKSSEQESHFTFLFNLPIILQKYLANVIGKHCNFKIKTNVFDNLSTNKTSRKIYPDLVYFENEKIVHISEIKFKEKLSREDIWQIAIYCAHYKLHKGTLIYITSNSNNDELFNIPMFEDSLEIRIFQISLANLKLESYLKDFTNKINNLIYKSLEYENK